MNEHNPAQQGVSKTGVLELATLLAISSYGIHFPDMGADAIKVEPLTGDPHRIKYYPTI